MSQKIIQVDAFTDKPFKGNPAAVCVMEKAAGENWMQNVALEMNLSETAFLYPERDFYNLRWFTPTSEVDLCGHATLASAHVLWEKKFLNADQTAKFMTKSGELTAQKKGDWIELNFPAVKSVDVKVPDNVIEAIGATPIRCKKADWVYLLELESSEIVRQVNPDFSMLAKQPVSDAIITGIDKSGEYDFVSRFFAPSVGINEDPVTGFAHCVLSPYWSERLGKDSFKAFQASQRGGELKLKLDGYRVLLMGQAITILKGELL